MSVITDVIIGIDMGATHIRFCIVDVQGNELYSNKRYTESVIKPELTNGLINTLHELLTGCHAQCCYMMLGLPAMIANDEQTIISAPNLALPATESVFLAKNLSAILNCPVQLARDVNMQLCWDVYQHQLQEKIVLAIYLGTGMGFAIWMNGAPWTGARGVAGELGHIPQGDNNKRCACGNFGCLETCCSGVALYNWYQQVERGFPFATLFLQSVGLPFIQQFLDHAARAIATTINLFDPDTVILGGGVMDMQGFPHERLIEQTRRYLRHPLPHNTVCFIRATSSDFNGARGAARLGRARYHQ